MKTQFFEASVNSKDVFKKCGDILREGGVVAFPTETVYGLGANALDKSSIEKIYVAKGRPSDNPLIVHISSAADLKNVVDGINEKGEILAEKFWPGPLTLIFKKNEKIPKEVTSGLDTVAVRLPANEIARQLIKFAGVPIAAPSANVSGRPSPTLASHVISDLNNKIDAIIDGGPCEFGIESTIIDVSVEPPLLLRPGSITIEDIEKYIGKIDVDGSVVSNQMLKSDVKPKAPGMKYKHYAPEGQITIVKGKEELVVDYIKNFKSNIKIGVLTINEHVDFFDKDRFFVVSLGKKEDFKEIGSNLFSAFRMFDDNNIKIILSESFDENEKALGIMNRLKKAAGYNIVNI